MKTLIKILCIVWAGFSFAQSSHLKIVQKPINYDAERTRLSIEYLKNRHGISQKTATINPKFIVLHYTGNGTLESNFKYFNSTKIDAARKLNANESLLNVSAHFLVDRDGTVYQLMPETAFARHTIGLNYCAIGVENIGGEKNPLTDAQVFANAALVRYLASKYKIEFLIGHSEYQRFRHTNYWKETNPNYSTEKADPGDNFMMKVRKLTQDLKLKDSP